MSDDVIEKIFTYIENKRDVYPVILREVNAISPAEFSKNTKLPMSKVHKWAALNLKHLGAFVTVSDLGFTEFKGVRQQISPVVHGVFRVSVEKPTICVYCHLESFSDDKPKCCKSDNIFGRGVVDAKGPLLCWFFAILSYKALGIELPLNIKFLIEKMKPYEEEEFIKYLRANKDLIFDGIKYICVPESPEREGTTPLISYGYRGCYRFNISVDGRRYYFDSSKYSGAVQEVTTDAIALLSSLVNSKGETMVPGPQMDILPVTPDEKKTCHASSCIVTRYKQTTGAHVLLNQKNKKRVLMHRTRLPTITTKIVTEASEVKARAKFTVFIVPYHDYETVHDSVYDHLHDTLRNRNSMNNLCVESMRAIKYWKGDSKDNNYKAACKAVRKVMKEEPELVQTGNWYSTIADLKDIVEEISIVLLPIGYADTSGALCVKSDVRTFMDGVKIVVSYINELAKF